MCSGRPAGAFNFGKVMLEGIGECKGHQAYVEFQNENSDRHRGRGDLGHHART